MAFIYRRKQQRANITPSVIKIVDAYFLFHILKFDRSIVPRCQDIWIVRWKLQARNKALVPSKNFIRLLRQSCRVGWSYSNCFILMVSSYGRQILAVIWKRQIRGRWNIARQVSLPSASIPDKHQVWRPLGSTRQKWHTERQLQGFHTLFQYKYEFCIIRPWRSHSHAGCIQLFVRATNSIPRSSIPNKWQNHVGDHVDRNGRGSIAFLRRIVVECSCFHRAFTTPPDDIAHDEIDGKNGR